MRLLFFSVLNLIIGLGNFVLYALTSFWPHLLIGIIWSLLGLYLITISLKAVEV